MVTTDEKNLQVRKEKEKPTKKKWNSCRRNLSLWTDHKENQMVATYDIEFF